MTEIFAAVGNFGFPIVVSVYLLVRFENKIDKLTASIDTSNRDLSKVIQENTKTTNDLVKLIERSKINR